MELGYNCEICGKDFCFNENSENYETDKVVYDKEIEKCNECFNK